MLDTELRLMSWRDGSTQSERLAAAALGLSGFEEIDPQAPLGGPDGSRDIICRKGGLTWVGAVYFPVAPVRFTAIKKKFNHDLAGVSDRHRGIAFVTNQSLSPGQRTALVKLASEAHKEAQILHLERLRALLDSPLGYGTRLQFLGIPMSAEEQLSWVQESGSGMATAINVNTRELAALKATIERLTLGQTEILRTIQTVGPYNILTPDLLSTSSFVKVGEYEPISSFLNLPLMLLFHRLTCFDLPSRNVGNFRTSDVWLGTPDGTRASHIQPPNAEEIPTLLGALCEEWRGGFRALSRGTERERLTALALFHARFLVIHPFFDGNGRAARAILMQQCLDLFGRADMSLMDKGELYYSALSKADIGDPSDLANILEQIVSG